MSIQESGELHNARPTLWHAHWRLAGNGPVLLLDRNFIGLSSSLDEKEYTMSKCDKCKKQASYVHAVKRDNKTLILCADCYYAKEKQ